MFGMLEADRTKDALHPAEKLTDSMIYQNLTSELISKSTGS
jgi:hypothetical protein